MANIRTFNDMSLLLKRQTRPIKVAVVCPRDASTQTALRRAELEGIVSPIKIDDEEPQEAARMAVEMVRKGEAEMIMKGLINTDVLLHDILNRETGLLPQGNVLTHVAVASIPAYHKLLFYTDAAVIPFPTQEQRIQQVRYISDVCRSTGIECPKIVLVHCSEKVDARHFPFTEGYQDIKAMALKGDFGHCIVDGPLDLKTSCSPHSMQVKGIQSPIEGDADALVFPDIESGNLFHKAITLFAGATTACMLQGACCPVVLPSRGDDAESKYYSLVLALLSLSNL